MQLLAFKMLLRKKGTSVAVVTIMLLVALLASVNCLVNNINSQTTLLTELVASGDTYLIVSKMSTCLHDSHVKSDLVERVKQSSNVKSAVFLCLAQVVIEYKGVNYTADAVGVDNSTAYFNNHHTYINGSISRSDLQANVGVVLANLISIQRNQQLNLTIHGNTCEFNVTGVVQDNRQSDSQVIIPLKTLESFNQAGFGYIEFSISDADQAAATLSNISRILPSDTKIVDTQQAAAFASDINNQMVQFIGVWSVAVYAVVAAASYVITTRMVSEAEYELDMLKVLGAKKPIRFGLVLFYGLIIAFVGSVIGLSLGVVGTQLASTFVRWVWGSSLLAPFLELPQVFTIMLLSLAAALLGGLYPAFYTGYRALGGRSL